MSKYKELIISAITLIVGICGCIAAWIVVPQVQSLIPQLPNTNVPMPATQIPTAQDPFSLSPAPGKSIVTGQIQWNDQPNTGISVLLIEGYCDGTPIAKTVSDQSGAFYFNNVNPGEYSLGLNTFTLEQLNLSDPENPLFEIICDAFPFRANADEMSVQNRDIAKVDVAVLSPTHNSTTGQFPEFSWEPYPNASYYEVSLFRMKPSSSETFIVGRTVSTNLSSPQQLEVGSLYSGFVEVYNPNGTRIASGTIPDFLVSGE